ncbi:MAG: ABC transporter permease [Chloroflexi bacterium]|jgi:ABC-2 type transport system permease protein|nr:ABC transporter permease [Chloroflexota bacterium]
MKKTMIIARHEFSQVVRRKGFYILTLGLPFIAFLGLFINDIVQDLDKEPDTPDHQNIGYVDDMGVFTGYTQQANLTFIPYPDQDLAQQDLMAGEINEYFVIPESYLQTGLVDRYTTERELEVPLKTWYQIRDFLLNNLLASEVNDDLLNRAKNPVQLNSWHLDETGAVSEPPDELQAILVPYFFGLLFIMSIFMTSGYLMHSVTEEKENRIMEILLSSVSVNQLLRGKIIGLGIAGLIQIVIWLVTIRVFLEVGSVDISVLEDIQFPPSMLLFGVIYFLLGYGLFSVLYAGLGAMSTSPRESQQMVGIFVMPAVVPLVLMSVIGENPEGGIAQALSFIPITAPTTVMMRLANINIPPWELALSITLLASSIALGLWLVARMFRAYLLMYGKRPTLREIVRTLR